MTSSTLGTRPLSVAAYDHGVHALRIYLQTFGRGYPSRAAAAHIVARLRELETVRYSDGRTQSTGIKSIIQALRSHQGLSGFRSARRELVDLDESLRSNIVRVPSRVELDRLHRILSGLPFNTGTPVNLWTIIARWVSGLINFFSSGLSESSAPFSLFGLVIVLVIVAGAFLFARRSLRRTLTSSALPLPGEENLSSQAARARAEMLSSREQYREALRYLLLSVLIGLQEARLIEVWAGLTNKELLDSLEAKLASAHAGARTTGAIDSLRALISHFDDVWYGNGAIDGARYRACADLTARAYELVTDLRAA